MYSIYAYIDPPNHPNVGKYGIHGVSGYHFLPPFSDEMSSTKVRIRRRKRPLPGREKQQQVVKWSISCAPTKAVH